MIYYHTQDFASRIVIWSRAKTLRDAGAALARNNRIWPEKSTDGKMVTVGKKQRGRDGIMPTKLYRLEGDRLRFVFNVEIMEAEQ